MEKITIKTEYITLGQFIKYIGLVSTGGEMKFFLLNEKILVNKIEENRRGKKLYKTDIIKIEGFGEYLIG